MKKQYQEDAIKNILKTAEEPLSQSEIAKRMMKNPRAIYTALQRLVKNSQIKKLKKKKFIVYSTVDFSSEMKKDKNNIDKNIGSFKKQFQKQGDVILLNKLFLGSWLEEKQNIGHEIIDYFLTDEKKYYVYNLPFGACPDYIWVEGTTGLTRKKEEKYNAKYMILTGPEKKRKKQKQFSFNIYFVIELKEKLHRVHSSKNKEEMKKRQQEVTKIIKRRKIKYNKKYLHEVYKNDESLFVTFKGSKIYKAKHPINVEIAYDFRHNKGYLKSDINKADYDTVIRKIKEIVKDNQSEYKLKSLSSNTKNHSMIYPTFLDLTGIAKKEEAYTNILASLLNFTENGKKEIFNEFCKEFNSNKVKFDDSQDYKIIKENTICEGRMDICADSPKQRVVIENKVFSGLNGLKKEDEKSQLSTYYKWGIEPCMANGTKRNDPLCFLVVPDFEKDIILNEIQINDPSMENVYQIITFGKVAEFIEKNRNRFRGYTYKKILDQIIKAFKNYSMSEQDKYADMFLEATMN